MRDYIADQVKDNRKHYSKMVATNVLFVMQKKGKGDSSHVINQALLEKLDPTVAPLEGLYSIHWY